MFRPAIALFGVLLLWPQSVSAQIYAWRDAKGTVVLSDRALSAPTHIYEVPGAPEYRTTRPAEGERSERARWDDIVVEHSAKHALRADLVRAVIQVESAYNPFARSPKGAMGLMQLMPATARALGVRNPFDPAENIRGGTTYLRQLLDRYSGDEELALAAYNAGSGAVDRYGRRVPPYRETRDYVKRVSSASGQVTTRTAGLVFYKTIEIADGRVIPRYSTQRPASGSFELIRR